MKFTMLCEQLGLSGQEPDAEKLHKLESWCSENVSRDLIFSGSLNEKYDNYLKLAETYLDNFALYLSDDSTQPMPQLHGATIFDTVVSFGLDKVLLSMRLSKDSVNKTNTYGMTPLHVAALEGYYYTVWVLLSLGADSNLKNMQSQLPLFSALVLPVSYAPELKETKIKIFRMLREKTPTMLNLQDNNGDTVLHLMATHGFSSLLEESVSSNPMLAYIKNNNSHYPVHTAILNDQLDCLRILLKDKDISILADSKGRVALHYAARYSGKEMVELCCDAAPTINPLDNTGLSPFMLAAAAGNELAMSMLIDKGVDVHLSDMQGHSVLHQAVYRGDISTVQWILDHTDININAIDKNHQTPLVLSEAIGNEKIINLLKSRGAVSIK
ncbi:ankyrin repeat domain-containing protein [Legionella bononiensis]|uniref:Ankyrin repeat domain-containing protein n=1 Tax=Legionella bononiensis TaxID=2793102 RepID=A0ABS1W759_9GAMM|nr:ankyrin repeat domain-containing protein [Legionella bononiensis]MBL7481304.1 ankyrin repeat domain-containing protein [Legionella bononiensis]MBL7525208.1 ankyrin repeat domain-containing protein [Legionella bononiensis]MBL7561391.1 ankyrin repeat domain-containing protein [Legionella bononiensis]